MSIDMSQLEDEIEFRCRNRNLPLLSQHYPMRELLLLHPLIMFLKLSVMPEAQQEARPIMHFNLHTLIRWEVDVVIARLFMRRDRATKEITRLSPPSTQISIFHSIYQTSEILIYFFFRHIKIF